MQLLHGDCLEVMRDLEANSVDTIITDPPYGLTFMGKNWDHGVPGVPFWLEALRVTKPGAFLLAFGGSRTYHRLTCAIEDAGWEIRDCIMWIYASGFPKSLDIGKAIDAKAGADRPVIGYERDAHDIRNRNGEQQGIRMYAGKERESYDRALTAPATDLAKQWDGWGSALKPAHEPIVVAMKPLDGTFAANAEKHGVAGLWIDGGRIGTDDKLGGGMENGTSSVSEGWDRPWRSNPDAIEYHKRETAAKIAKAESLGRWPANVIFDEASGALLDAMSGESRSSDRIRRNTAEAHNRTNSMGKSTADWATGGYSDTGGASRFFFCAKASRSERNAGLEGMPERTAGGMAGTADLSLLTGSGNVRNNKAQNHHPTVKPLALMEYLCKLTRTPTGGVVLDPFMGSGSTGVACVMTDRDFIGIEQDAEYLEIARARIEAEQAKPKQLGLAI